MRPLKLAIAFALAAGCSDSSSKTPPAAVASTTTPAGTPAGASAAKAPRPPVPLEEYFKIRRVGSRNGILVSFSHDEKQVAYLSDESGRTEVWVQPIDGGPATQLTHVKGFVQNLAFSPVADQLVYGADNGGDELPHLFLTDSKGTALRDLNADLPAGRRADFVEWADDGKTFLFLSSARDARYQDLYEYNVASGKAERLWDSSGTRSFEHTSRDHRRFIISDQLSDVDSNLYLVERGAKDKAVLLTPHKGEVRYSAEDLSRDGKTLYFTSDEGREFVAAYAMDLAKHTSKPILSPEWDVERARFTHNWKYFVTAVNADGQSKVEVREAATQKPVTLPAPPPGSAWIELGSSPTDRYLAMRLQGDGAPTAPYVIDMQTGKARQVIDPLPPSLRERKMAIGELVRVPSFDGKQVPAFLYKPEGAGPFPAVIDVHGGPTAQSRRDFGGVRQYLVTKGYVVLVPNVRGSTGYGKSYTKLDNHDFGGGPLKDVVACKQWLAQSAHVDANKVVVMGGSYGGYMALASATYTPNEFAANVDYFGVSDLKSLVESFPAYWMTQSASIYRKFGDPKNPADAQYQHDRSPIYFVDRITRPLLVVQGDKDARVKKDQSDRIVEALKQRKVPVHYLVLTDEGHGFSRTESALAAAAATDRFLDRYIFGDTSVEVLK